MKYFVFRYLLLFISVNCLKVGTRDMLVSFVTYDDRPTSVLIPFLCWSPNEIRILARNLSSSGITVACSLQTNRPEFHLHHVLIIADLGCPGVNTFLIEASNKGFMKSPYRWLLLDEDGVDLDILERLVMLVDSDVVVARNRGEEVHFIEVYKISENKELIYTTRSIWRSKYYKFPELNSLTNNSVNKNNTITINKGNKDSAYGVIEDYRKTKVISLKRMNLRRHTLTMGNVVKDSNETRNHLDDRLYLGIDAITKISYAPVKVCFDMLNASEKLLFTHTWGYKDNKGSWQNRTLMDHFLKKETDMGTLLLFTQERLEVIDYITVVGSTRLRFIFRQPPLSYVSNIFTLPFTTTVWLASLISVLACSVFLYITAKWESTMDMHPLQLDGSWADVLIFTIGAVLVQGCNLEPRYTAGRCVTFFLFVTITVLFSAYTANIVVLLRAPSSSVRTLSDLLNSPLKLGASNLEYNRYFFKKLNEPLRKEIYNKKIEPHGQKPNYYNLAEGIEKVRKGMFAFHLEVVSGYRQIQETYQEHEKCDLVEMDYVNEIDPWLPAQKRSPFKELFKINFLKIRETGIQACILHRLMIPMPKCSGEISSFSSVGIGDMQGALMATLYGVILAPVVLLLEIAYRRLLSLKKNRKLARDRLRRNI